MARHLDASFVTEVVILLGWALTTWYVYFTFRESGHAKKKTITLTLGILFSRRDTEEPVTGSSE